MNHRLGIAGALLAGAAGLMPAVARAQDALFIDSSANVAWVLHDQNGDGVITEPGEIGRWFDQSNAAGTPGLDNPSSLAVRWDGLTFIGDQGLGAVLRLRDHNVDQDAQDAGESMIAADASNAAGAVFTFPGGLGFDPLGFLYIANAGNASGPDRIWRCEDLTGEGDFQDAGEITPVVGGSVFGATNGPYGPQEVAFIPAAVAAWGLVRNSSTGLHGVYLFTQSSFAPYFDAANASGIVPSAGFALELDLVNTQAFYTIQVASGGLDQLIRFRDINGDLDAQDQGEAAIVFETAEPSFNALDAASLYDGRVFVTNSSLGRVIALKDIDGDGRFMSAGERSDYFANATGLAGNARQIALLPAQCYPDCNASATLTIADFACFQVAFAAGDPYADCNASGTHTIADFGCFQARFAAGCP